MQLDSKEKRSYQSEFGSGIRRSDTFGFGAGTWIDGEDGSDDVRGTPFEGFLTDITELPICRSRQTDSHLNGCGTGGTDWIRCVCGGSESHVKRTCSTDPKSAERGHFGRFFVVWSRGDLGSL